MANDFIYRLDIRISCLKAQLKDASDDLSKIGILNELREARAHRRSFA